ncbi:hypothetical protein AVEN_249915-1 [Araneus ventricosus]|uniref:BHLH domain-containing protein n=1 Tax=Araneus ventricosus TaxID=182803 RepID=A0A4Y2DYR8_ARAVE|nr:hypothetical protein AVEN_249915-1 [Araneus ventricosus]
MARSKSKDLPHHVKERLRHQKLQKILENVASHVPKPATTKRETKAKKLRRVVLYMKYLIHKNEELNKTNLVAIKRTTKCQDISAKTNVSSLEFPSKHKPRSKRAHIVFLTKFSDASVNKQKDTETLIHQKCCSKYFSITYCLFYLLLVFASFPNILGFVYYSNFDEVQRVCVDLVHVKCYVLVQM